MSLNKGLFLALGLIKTFSVFNTFMYVSIFTREHRKNELVFIRVPPRAVYITPKKFLHSNALKIWKMRGIPCLIASFKYYSLTMMTNNHCLNIYFRDESLSSFPIMIDIVVLAINE